MKIFDAHSHIYQKNDILTLKNILKENHDYRLVISATDENSWLDIKNIATDNKNIFPQFGIHPWFVESRPPLWDIKLKNILKENERFSIGESGLDKTNKYKSSFDIQKKVFIKQLCMAKKMNRPITIHAVKCWGELVEIIKKQEKIRGIIHSFSGSLEIANELIKAGLLLSFSISILNNISPKTVNLIKEIPINNIVIESDYITSKKATSILDTLPNKMELLIEQIALIKNMELSTVERILFNNCSELMG